MAAAAAAVRGARRESAAADGVELGFVRFVGIGVTILNLSILKIEVYLGNRRPVERNIQTAATQHTATAPANRSSIGTS